MDIFQSLTLHVPLASPSPTPSPLSPSRPRAVHGNNEDVIRAFSSTYIRVCQFALILSFCVCAISLKLGTSVDVVVQETQRVPEETKSLCGTSSGYLSCLRTSSRFALSLVETVAVERRPGSFWIFLLCTALLVVCRLLISMGNYAWQRLCSACDVLFR